MPEVADLARGGGGLPGTLSYKDLSNFLARRSGPIAFAKLQLFESTCVV